MGDSTLGRIFDSTVGNSMGVVSIPFPGPWPRRTAIRTGVSGVVSVLIIFSLPVWLVGEQDWTPILSLSIWGAFYFGWAVFTARQTTEVARSLIVDEIEPLLSEPQTQHIGKALRERFSRLRVVLVSLLVASLAIAASIYALRDANVRAIQLGLISVEFYIFYATGAQATYAACFYGVFAEAVENEPQSLSVLAPSQSPVIEAVHALGRTVVMFWFGIMISVLTLTLFRSSFEVFILIVIPVASFFSFFFGSAVFLVAEARLRRSSRQAAAQIHLRLDTEVRALLNQTDGIDSSALERLQALSEIEASVSAGRGTPGIVFRAISIATPIVSAAVPLAIKFWPKAGT